MNGWLLMILCLAGIFVGNAAEIVAWKVPSIRFFDEAEKRGGVLCKTAPEDSPFFKDGDELWDLKNVMPDGGDQKLSLDWLFWNATSGRLVAKGGWIDLCTIHEILRVNALPKHLKLNVNLYEVAADGAPLAENTKPVTELSIRVRSEQNSKANWGANGITLAVETEVTLADTNSSADVRLAVTAEVPNQPRLQVNTAFILKAGSPLWVARDFDGQQGLDLKVSGTMESVDGVPLNEVVMIQKGSATRSLWPQQRSHEYQTRPVGGVGWFMSCLMSPGELASLINISPESNPPDPFAEQIMPVRTKLLLTTPVEPPALIISILDHEVLDATEWLRKVMLISGGNLDSSGSFAGYDPIGQRLYFYSPSQEAVDVAREYLIPMCNRRPALVRVTLDGIGQTRLIVRSGQKASLERVVDQETIRRSLEIEPTIGENDDMVDLRFKFEDRADAKKISETNSSTSFSTGKALEIITGKWPDGEVRSLRVTGEILRTSPVDGQ